MSNMDSSDGDEVLSSLLKAKIKPEITREILRSHFKDSRTKLSDEALALVNEVVRCLVLEASLRSSKKAVIDQRKTIELEQAEKIIPQLILDFP